MIVQTDLSLANTITISIISNNFLKKEKNKKQKEAQHSVNVIT